MQKRYIVTSQQETALKSNFKQWGAPKEILVGKSLE